MIEEYLQMSEHISARAVHVGRVIQNARHHAFTTAAFPAAVPQIRDMTTSYVGIVIGRDNAGAYIVIDLPTPIFDHAGDGDLRIWVLKQNQAAETREKQDSDQQAARKREDEVAALRELMLKYPEETAK